MAHLTDPAPVEGAAGLGADHVHAPAVPLRGRPAAGTRLADHPDGHGAGVGAQPAGPGGPGVRRVHGGAPLSARAVALLENIVSSGKDLGLDVFKCSYHFPTVILDFLCNY